MFDSLNDRLDKAFHVLSGRSKITEINIAESIKEIRRALVEADVSFKIAKDFTSKVKTKAMGENVLTSLKPGQLMMSNAFSIRFILSCMMCRTNSASHRSRRCAAQPGAAASASPFPAT